MVSASSDATVRVWDAKTCNCLVTFRPPQSSAGAEASISSVHFNPQNVEQLMVCPRASTIYVMTMQVILQRGGRVRGQPYLYQLSDCQGVPDMQRLFHILTLCMRFSFGLAQIA